MSLDFAILGFLSEREHSGYDLKTRCFDREARHFWTADQAQVYRTLDRLEHQRLVVSRYQPQRGKPGRKLYSITTPGREELGEWLASEHESPPYRDPFLIQLYFADELPFDTLASVLEHQRAEHQSRLEELRRQLANRSQPVRISRREELARLTLEAALTKTRATIDWIDDCIETLEGHERASGAEPTPQRQLFDPHRQSGRDGS